MLKERIITALIMVTLVAAGILYLPPLGLAIMFGVLVSVAAWEWSALAGLSSAAAKLGFTLLVAVLLVLVALHSQLFSAEVLWSRVKDVLGLACLWWAIALLWVKGYPGSAPIWQSTPMRLLMGLLTLVPAWVALVYLRLQQEGEMLIFILIGLVTAADIGAYFSGRAWGKAKLAPAVSPGKSWAGFWGGMTATSGLGLLVWLLELADGFSLLAIMIIAMLTTLASVLGDLLESMVKRQQGVKDSGRILPGHGGMMDRLDSMTAAAPVFALCLMLVGG